MASTTLAKATYCLAGAGVLLGGGYAAKTWIIGDRIDDLLRTNNPKYQLLATNSSVDRWKKSWFKYRQENQGKDKDAWNLADWKKEANLDESSRAPASFIDACETKSQERVTKTEDPLYQEVLRWCTGDATIKELIRDAGKRTLTDKSFDNEGWKELLKNYVQSHKNSNPLDIDWIGDTEKSPENNEELLKRFKGKCQELADKEVEGTTDPNYEKVNLHCSANIKAEDIVREFFKGKALVNLNKIKGVGNESSIPQTIWNKYTKNNNDPWGIISGEATKATMPNNFWDKCSEKRKTEVKDTEHKVFKEVLDYCTVDAKNIGDYAEKFE